MDATMRDGARVKRAKSCARKVSQRDSDDFVDDVPHTRMAEITNNRDVKGKKVIAASTDDNDVDAGNGTDSDDDDMFPSLNTRSSSSIFVKVLSSLTDIQKQAVHEMGLGSLLDLGITSTPSKMGFWLVDRFNHMDRKLQLYEGEKVHKKEGDVHAALGLPRGEIVIRNKQKRVTSELYYEWVGLFNVRIPSNITASKVADKIQECVDGGDWFKRHFIVLMVTCLFESSSNGMANFRLVHMLDDLTKVFNIDWCSYMIRCLVDTKKSWDAVGRQKKYTGPLLFLTPFYVDKVVLSMRSVARLFLTFRSWSNELLKARKRAEISSGAFGRGFVDTDVSTVVGHHHQWLDKVGVSANDGESKNTMEHSVQPRSHLARKQQPSSPTSSNQTISSGKNFPLPAGRTTIVPPPSSTPRHHHRSSTFGELQPLRRPCEQQRPQPRAVHESASITKNPAIPTSGEPQTVNLFGSNCSSSKAHFCLIEDSSHEPNRVSGSTKKAEPYPKQSWEDRAPFFLCFHGKLAEPYDILLAEFDVFLMRLVSVCF
ncbi:Unknown protein [Striga hermonthica]|uniref:Aminotransferase-like plant mobile domain-containing protein n=1 Tax=Striga hermonthica TaxID=68872 RepID=A0A9N7NAM4_STRHE|nr:Unknown protein [Striga hermonthica]